MRSIVLLTLVLALLVPASAAGSIAMVTTVNDRLTGLPVSQISYVAQAGERNAVTVAAAAGIWEIRDTGANVQAGAGCVLVDAHAARCANPSPGAYALRITTGDLDDSVDVPFAAGNAIVSGGAGDDALRGGARATFSGGAGNDVFTLAGVPPTLSCGRGSDLLWVGDRARLILHRLNLQPCEHLRIERLVVALTPRRRGRALVMSARCAATRARCRGAVYLRLWRAGRSTPVGRDYIRLKAGGGVTLRVALNAGERRLLAARGTVVEVRLIVDGVGRRVRWRARPVL